MGNHAPGLTVTHQSAAIALIRFRGQIKPIRVAQTADSQTSQILRTLAGSSGG